MSSQQQAVMSISIHCSCPWLFEIFPQLLQAAWRLAGKVTGQEPVRRRGQDKQDWRPVGQGRAHRQGLLYWERLGHAGPWSGEVDGDRNGDGPRIKSLMLEQAWLDDHGIHGCATDCASLVN